MKSRTIYILASLFIFLFYSETAIPQVLIPSKNADKVLLNGIWKFKYFASSAVGSDSTFFEPQVNLEKWANIKAPGNWELQGFAEPNYGSVKEGTGLYRRSFTVPASWKGQPVYVAFDGVQYGYDLWVNGKHAGNFSSSYNRQTFDISRFVKPGATATIALRVSTRVKGWEFDTNDCWALSGVIRDITLFTLPVIHVKDLIVRTYTGSKDATLSVSTLIEKEADKPFGKSTSVSAKLFDPVGKLVNEFALNQGKVNSTSDTAFFAQRIKILSPHLWTAETPNLYTLNVIVKNNNIVLQQYSQKIGIREVTWNNGVLKLNGVPIKLRGTDHHDLSPVNGRATTDAEIKKDLKLMQEANINFIRTSHYQPHPRLIELCDSLGFYVMEEVPFGFGDQHLTDTTYLPILKKRAKATLWRDKNHPSIIVWSVGNENPLTPICIETGNYVKQLDPTRPYCFPQDGGTFSRIADKIPPSVDILAPHYPVPVTLKEYAKKFDRPIIATEYSHALGLDFDRMEAIWEIMYASPRIAGGAVWHFFDQGILRKSPTKTTPGTFTTSVWIDSTTVYDNHGNEGADGLVYANRVPQVDYWQVRKVYTPVKPLDDTLQVSPGKQTVRLKLINRYDFTNLSQVQCKWTVYEDAAVLQTGSSAMACAPHDTLSLGIPINLPAKLDASYYTLKVQFSDKHNYVFYEKVYPLITHNNSTDLLQKLSSASLKPILNNGNINFGNFSFSLNDKTGMLRLTDKSGTAFLADGPYARMGRKSTMSEQATTQRPNRNGTVNINPIWKPYILTTPEATVESKSANHMVVKYNYERQNPKGQFISGTVDYAISDSGSIHISYRFIPNHATGLALEAGLSFLVPSSLTEFRWAGKGPYPAYPGKDRLDEFGLYHLNSADINYQGNHEDVDVAVFSDAQSNAFAIVADKANISVENSPEGIIVSHNAYVSGRFNKGTMPEKRINVENLKEISGNFTIVPLGTKWPQSLENLFGKPTIKAAPFAPFYNSYDQ